jgi:hypothetical protein|tara:strand:- start:71 stop:370 length:300 start_codon:yes stop_codon:yes gene_type:complete
MAEVKTINEKAVINIEETDITKVKEFREEFADVTAKIGEIEVERLNAVMVLENITAIKTNLAEKFTSLRSGERKITEEFQKKYGEGEFNIEEGTFTPIS